MLDQGFTSLAQLADTVDYQAGRPDHSRRVAMYVKELAAAVNLEAVEAGLVVNAARLHDIGMLGLPQEVLHNPGSLTPDDWVLIRDHPQRGADFLGKSGSMQRIGELILCHHERWDGTGYPQNLRGKAIPLGARIIAVADSFDAMITDRPYRGSMVLAAAIAILMRGAGAQWDRVVAAAFLDQALPALLQQKSLLESLKSSAQDHMGASPASGTAVA